MTPSPQGTTPSQAPVMNREDWERRIKSLRDLETATRFNLSEKTWSEAVKIYKDSFSHLLDAIMSLQAEVKSLQDDKFLLNRKVEIALDEYAKAKAEVETLKSALAFYASDDTYHIDILGACGLSNDMDEWGQFGKKAKEALEAIEKARQPK